VPNTKNTPYLRLASSAESEHADAALTLRLSADHAVGVGQGSVTATLVRYDGQPSYYLDLPDIGDDGEVDSLETVEAIGRALIALARKARTPRMTPVRTFEPPRILS
jgi:hypothetical protein